MRLALFTVDVYGYTLYMGLDAGAKEKVYRPVPESSVINVNFTKGIGKGPAEGGEAARHEFVPGRDTPFGLNERVAKRCLVDKRAPSAGPMTEVVNAIMRRWQR